MTPPPEWITDAIIAASYFAIPVGLAWTARARAFRLSKRILYLAAAFIVLCGAGHGRHAWLEWHGRCASFDLATSWMNLATASASILFVAAVIPHIGLFIAAVELPGSVRQMREFFAWKAARDAGDGPQGSA